MKKKFLILLFLIFIISGCDEATQEKADEKYNDKVLEIEKNTKFNEADFDYHWNTCGGNPFCVAMGTSKNFYVYYKPENGDKKLVLNIDGVDIKDFDAEQVADFYLEDYIFNEFIFDSSKGNNLVDLFKELDSYNVKYYIATNDDDSGKKHSEFCDENDSRPSRRDISDYLDGKDIETLDMYEYMKFLGCEVTLEILLDESNLEAENITIDDIKTKSKEYYNKDYLTVKFSFFNFQEDGYYQLIDSTEHYKNIGTEEDLSEYTPEYYW